MSTAFSCLEGWGWLLTGKTKTLIWKKKKKKLVKDKGSYAHYLHINLTQFSYHLQPEIAIANSPE